MLDSGQWTRHKSGFQKIQKLPSFFMGNLNKTRQRINESLFFLFVL
jgi:hypothetical protein